MVTTGHFNKGIAFALRYRILHDLLNMSVSDFVQAMREFNSHNDFVTVRGIWTNRERGVVWELSGTNIAMMPARAIQCKFYGGPPGNRQYYEGTLLTMFMDRVMSDALDEGMKAAGKLFPNEYNLTS